MTLSDDERKEIWGQVKKLKDDEACWPWLGPMKDGFGVFLHEGKRIPAHRVIYEIAHDKEIPKGSVVRQNCGSWNCCNPKHLVEATRVDSARRANKRRKLRPKAGPQTRILSMHTPGHSNLHPLVLGEDVTATSTVPVHGVTVDQLLKTGKFVRISEAAIARRNKERRRRSRQMPAGEVTISESPDYDGDMAGFVRTLLPHDAMETQIEAAQALYEGKDVVIQQVGKRETIYRLRPKEENRGFGVLFVEPAPEWHGDVEQLCFSCAHAVPYHVPGRVQCQIRDTDSPTKGIVFTSDSCKDWEKK